MDYIKEISIVDAVIHVLDNMADEPILNHYALELNDETYSFVYKHIKRCLESTDLKYAIFNEDEENKIRNISNLYLKADTDILSISIEYAKEMFALMKAKGNIESCDLLTVGFCTEYGQFVGILKMDYIKNYVHSIDFVDDKIGIDIVQQRATLPQTGAKIKKAAFIKDTGEYDDGYDLLVIDKNSKQDEDYGQDYFISNFLNCKIVDNERDMTKNFFEITERWANVNLHNNAEDQLRIRRMTRDAIKNDNTICIDEFVDNLYSDDSIKEEFKELAKSMGAHDSIDIDKEYANKIVRKTKFKIDSGIELSIPDGALDDFEQFEIKRNGDGTINMVIKNIRNYKQN